ncbi:MAG: rod shape-determining protein MreD [Phototrophicales bacterium]|nr:rod shape-determining protein MreD [Phototrophicales bacterium]
MGNFLSFPILIVAALLQATFMPQIRLLGGSPDLVYLIVLAWSINVELDSSVIWAFVGGISLDLMSYAPLGTSTFGIVITVFIISGIGQQVYRIGFVLLIGSVLIGTFFQQLSIMIILTITGYSVDWGLSLGYVVAPTIFYNLVFILPLYWIIRRIQRRVVPEVSSKPTR